MNRLLQPHSNGHANGKLRYSAQDWSGPSTGAHGGTYWTSRKTGEKVYQAQNPGGNDATPQGKPDQPQSSSGVDPEALKAKAQKYVQQARDKWGDKAHENLTRIAANYANDQTPEGQRKLAAVKAMLGALGEKPASSDSGPLSTGSPVARAQTAIGRHLKPIDPKDIIQNTNDEFEVRSGSHTFTATREGKHSWEIEFRDTGNSMRQTGNSGAGAVGVFSSVGSALAEFIKAKDPKKFGFHSFGEEESRIKLYDRLSQSIGEHFGYAVHRDDERTSLGQFGDVEYRFRKRPSQEGAETTVPKDSESPTPPQVAAPASPAEATAAATPPEQPAPKAKPAAKPPRGMFHADPLAAAHEKLKALYDSAITDDSAYENTDAAMAEIGKTMGLRDLRELAAKFGLHDIGRTKSEVLGNIGRKIKGRREFHDRMDVHLEKPLRHAVDDYSDEEPDRYEAISLDDIRRMPGPEAAAYARGVLAMLQRQPALRREFKLEDLAYLEMIARDVDRYAGDEPKRKFSSTQFDLAGDVAKAIRAMADSIPDSELAEDGREDKPHVTIKYGLHTNDAADVADVVAGFGSVEIEFGKISIFTANEASAQRGGEQYDVVKVEIESERLRELNALISDSLDCADTHPEYQPHATLAYVKPGEGAKYVGDERFVGVIASFGTLTFSNLESGKTPIDLGGGKPAGQERLFSADEYDSAEPLQFAAADYDASEPARPVAESPPVISDAAPSEPEPSPPITYSREDHPADERDSLYAQFRAEFDRLIEGLQ